jgi:hypothetical protein
MPDTRATIDLPERIVTHHRGDTLNVAGVTVAPGLAITTAMSGDSPVPRRYILTHLGSGLALGGARCATHIQDCVTLAVNAGVDWAQNKDTLLGNPALGALGMDLLVNGRLSCNHRCPGEPPAYKFRCNTCHYEQEDDEMGDAFTEAEVREVARDHQCEPDVEIAPADTQTWSPVGNPGRGY